MVEDELAARLWKMWAAAILGCDHETLKLEFRWQDERRTQEPWRAAAREAMLWAREQAADTDRAFDTDL